MASASEQRFSITGDPDPNEMDVAPAASTNLQARGKGKHVCPYGANCDRGGISESGSAVVFERNSAFR